MAWVRIDDHAPEHPKQLKAGPLACWLWVCGLAWCSRHSTDGEIPHEALPTFGIKDASKWAAKLVLARLWDATDTGYRVHDYLAYQPSGEQISKRRAAAAQRLGAWRVKHGYVGGNGDETPLQNVEKHDGSSPCNTTPVPVPVPLPVPIREACSTSGAVLLSSGVRTSKN